MRRLGPRVFASHILTGIRELFFKEVTANVTSPQM